MAEAEYSEDFVEHDGQRLGLHVYPDQPGSPVVVIWPAMGVPARYYRPFARQLTDRGLSVVVADLRGTGSSQPAPTRRSRYGYTELTADVAAVLDALKTRTDGRRVVLLGHSLGGQLCALHLAVGGGPAVDGLVLVAVGLPWYRSYVGRARWGVLALVQTIAAMTAVLRVWPGWAFGGRQARGVIRDWAYTARHGKFRLMEGTDVDAALARVSTPVLAISVSDDRYTPPGTVDQLCAKFAAASVQRVHVTEADAGAHIDHFRWVRASVPVAQWVCAFAGNDYGDQRDQRGQGVIIPSRGES